MSDDDEIGEVEQAVTRTLEELDEVSPLHDGLSATARILARKLDGDAGLATAAVARELRVTLEALVKESGGNDDALDRLIARLSAPMGHPEV